MTFRYADLTGRFEDREFNLFLSITSISAAFLAIVLPTTSNSGEFFQITTYIFFIEVLIGIGLMLLNINYSHKMISNDSSWVNEMYEKLINKSSELLSKAKLGTINQNDLDNYWAIRDELHKNIDQIKENHRKSLPGKILHLSWIFYVIFAIGIALLLINSIQPRIRQEFINYRNYHHILRY